MKKTILFLAIIATTFSSCSSDNGDGNLEVNIENLSGTWYIKEVIQADGQILPYINMCAGNRDYVKFYNYYKTEYHYKYTDCIPVILYSCTDYYFTEDGVIHNCNNLLDGTVSVLTNKTMRIDYSEIKSFGLPDNNLQSAKGIILSKE